MAQESGIYLFLLLLYLGSKDLSWPGGSVAATCQEICQSVFLGHLWRMRETGKRGDREEGWAASRGNRNCLNKTFLMITSSEASTGSK